MITLFKTSKQHLIDKEFYEAIKLLRKKYKERFPDETARISDETGVMITLDTFDVFDELDKLYGKDLGDRGNEIDADALKNTFEDLLKIVGG